MKNGIPVPKELWIAGMKYSIAELWSITGKMEYNPDIGYGWHRTDGPAVIYHHDGYGLWYLNGSIVHSFGDFKSISGITEEELLILKLKYSYPD